MDTDDDQIQEDELLDEFEDVESALGNDFPDL